MTKSKAIIETGWNLDSSYARLPKLFFTILNPIAVRSPELIILNYPLATSLGLNVAALQSKDGVVVLAAWMHGFGGAGRRCRVVLEAESCSFALDIYLDQHMQIQQAGRRTLCLSALGSNVSSVSAPLLLAARVSGVEPYFCGSSDKKRQWQGGSR